MKKKSKKMTVWVNWWGNDPKQEDEASIYLTKWEADEGAKEDTSPRVGNRAHKLIVWVPLK